MAYTHSKYEVIMQRVEGVSTVHPTAAGAGGAGLNVTTPAAMWAPGFVPHVIKGAALVMSASDVPSAATPINFEADISTPGTPTNLFNIHIPAASAAARSIYYRPTYYIEIKPGMTVNVRPTTAATAGVRAHCILYVEPRWEEPGNVSTMIATT